MSGWSVLGEVEGDWSKHEVAESWTGLNEAIFSLHYGFLAM